MKNKTLVRHWRFEDGKVRTYDHGNKGGRVTPEPIPRGWYCWVFPEDDHSFEIWMNRMCPTADITHRFNSGNPMWTVYIKEDAEATAFQMMYGEACYD